MKAMPRVVSGLLVAGDKILMGLRPMGKKRGGLWELPGGKVEKDEDPREAVFREWKEEIGIEVFVEDFIATTTLHLETTFVVELYQVIPHDLQAKHTANAHDALSWFNPQYAMEMMPCSPAYYLHYPYLVKWLEQR